jgi:serine/threonine protein kinase
MTHANLREHEYIIPALAYGWTENPLHFARLPGCVWRGQSARLSDFGAAIFESDGQRTSFAGTTLYKAPDILFDSANYSSHEAISVVYYSADIYSFGLTTWETMMNGKAFICTDWLGPDESPRAFLSRLPVCNKSFAVTCRRVSQRPGF